MMVHWSEDDLRAYRSRGTKILQEKRPPKRREMNKTEKRYAEKLDTLILAGVVRKWWFEPIKLRISPNWRGTYTPDFLVDTGAGLSFREVKGGYVREDALKAFKAAAELYPCFGWKMVQWKAGVWKVIQEF